MQLRLSFRIKTVDWRQIWHHWINKYPWFAYVIFQIADTLFANYIQTKPSSNPNNLLLNAMQLLFFLLLHNRKLNLNFNGNIMMAWAVNEKVCSSLSMETSMQFTDFKEIIYFPGVHICLSICRTHLMPFVHQQLLIY